MFGFGKKPLDAQQFNNIYIASLVHLTIEGGGFPRAGNLLVRIESVLPQMKAKLSPEQERSITILDSLMPSQKSQLVELAKKVAAEMPTGNRKTFDSLADHLYRWAVLSDPSALDFLKQYAGR